MIRAMSKGAMLFGFGRVPGGARFCRRLTREWMGTQGTHVDKLRRVWPGYLEVWRSRCGLELEGLDVWVHEAGWTPFAPLVNYLLTGKGGALTNSEGRVLDRYLARAVNGVLSVDLPETLVSAARRRPFGPLRTWRSHRARAPTRSWRSHFSTRNSTVSADPGKGAPASPARSHRSIGPIGFFRCQLLLATRSMGLQSARIAIISGAAHGRPHPERSMPVKVTVTRHV
jgi:hypothetical protein